MGKKVELIVNGDKHLLEPKDDLTLLKFSFYLLEVNISMGVE